MYKNTLKITLVNPCSFTNSSLLEKCVWKICSRYKFAMVAAWNKALCYSGWIESEIASHLLCISRFFFFLDWYFSVHFPTESPGDATTSRNMKYIYILFLNISCYGVEWLALRIFRWIFSLTLPCAAVYYSKII